MSEWESDIDIDCPNSVLELKNLGEEFGCRSAVEIEAEIVDPIHVVPVECDIFIDVASTLGV